MKRFLMIVGLVSFFGMTSCKSGYCPRSGCNRYSKSIEKQSFDEKLQEDVCISEVENTNF
ncbi:hypothetical protein SAMN05216480_11652 [Pustulibacterium marinum]|uniref:Lipoprotein n=2 Tax=Pustulibacterium marinum TaxID=1224947 RepID=A0A1I7IHF6_9FLAO|nr:hypothetical protein SAMN05216480_11652 [Pustulibacterium marinum]